MSLLTVILTLVVLGLILWGVSFIPMPRVIKTIITVVVVIAVVLWLLQGFGVIDDVDEIPLPKIKN